MHDDDEPLTALALNSEDAQNWRKAMNKELNTLETMQCWDLVERQKKKRVLHTIFVLNIESDEFGAVTKYKARLAVCKNKEIKNETDCTFPNSEFSRINI